MGWMKHDPKRVETLNIGGPEGYIQLAGQGSILGTANCRSWRNDSAIAILDFAEVWQP
jgi:hypothetical protein